MISVDFHYLRAFMFSDLFVEDHRKIDILLAEFISSLKGKKSGKMELEELRNHLKKHICFEENVLFRMIDNSENHARINGLEVEHAGIMQLLDKIEFYIEGGDSYRALDRAEGLGRLFATHNEAELRNAYSMLDSLSEAEKNAIMNELNVFEVPEGWKCKVLRRYSRKVS